MKKYFSKVVIIICITCLFLSTMYIMRNFLKDKKQNQIFAELQNSEYNSVWLYLLAGSSAGDNDIVEVAKQYIA